MAQHSLDEDVNPERSTPGHQTLHAQFSPIYTAGFHQCLSKVSSYMTTTDSSEADSDVTKLKVCLDGHLTSSGRRGHGKEQQLPTNDAPTSRLSDSPLMSQQLTPPHSPFFSCSSSTHSPPPPPPSLSHDPSFLHNTSLHSFDIDQRSPSSSSPAPAFPHLSRLTTSQSPSPIWRPAVSYPTGSTWRPWN